MAIQAKRVDLERDKTQILPDKSNWTLGSGSGSGGYPAGPAQGFGAQGSGAQGTRAPGPFTQGLPSQGLPGQQAQWNQTESRAQGNGASSERLRLLDPALADSLGQLARLMANVTDSYTSAIFLCDSVVPTSSITPSASHSSSTGSSSLASSSFGGNVGSLNESLSPTAARTRTLELVAFHTLSRDVVPHARIAFGSGLIGWTAENGVRISVCPFENDSSTLLFYSQDQALKSFIALPIIDSDGMLIGVLSCDSKKSYAFAKITEKVLLDCAAQIAHLVSLHGKLRVRRSAVAPTAGLSERDELNRFLDHLRAQSSEEILLTEAANLPQDMVERDALVIVTAPQYETKDTSWGSGAGSGVSSLHASNLNAKRNLGAGIFTSPTNQPRVSNRLMELVCRHKRVLCGDRNVHALTNEEKLQRSFLSIPFRVLNREAGSINVLTPAFGSFCPNEILVLERMAEVLGHEIELRRLRDRVVSAQEKSGLLSWKGFSVQARAKLEECSQQKKVCSLIRLRVPHPGLLEDRLGTEEAQNVFQQVLRLIDQVKGSSGLACFLAGTDCLVLIEGNDCERLLTRLRLLIDRMDFSAGSAAVGNGQGKFSSNVKEEIRRGLHASAASAPIDGETLEVLVSKTLRRLEIGLQKARMTQGEVVSESKTEKRSQEDTTNAFCW